MNKYQNARHQANERGSLFLAAHDAELILIVLYASLKASFNSIMEKIYAAIQKQYEQTGYLTLDKNLQRDLVGSTVMKYARIGSVQAFNTNHPELAVALNVSLSFLIKGSDNAVLGKANGILKIITDNSAIFTEITPANILEMKNVILDFKNLMSMPKSEMKLKKAEGTDPIPGLLNDQDTVKEYIGNFLLAYFPDLYNTWMGEIKVGTPAGVRQTSWIISNRDAKTGVPLRKVKVTISNGVNTISKYSSAKGYVHFYSLDSDNYSLIAEHDSFVTHQKNETGIDDQHIEKTEIKLQKANSTGILSLTVLEKGTNKPVPGVELNIPALGYTHTIADDGKESVDNMNPGVYQGTLSCDGYQVLDFTFTILALKTTSLQLSMVKEL